MNRSAAQYEFFDPPAKAGEIGRLGPYRVSGLLGKGGMGQVFLAVDGRLKRQVALKVMNSKFASTPNSKQRFVEEARAMAAVQHDNVATIFEVGLRSGTPFIAMEMLQGKTLEGWHKEGTGFTTERILEVARDVAAGLSAAHERGIVHRDIKPANIWIEHSGRAKILDFGLAIAGTDRFSRRGSVMGTPGYLSPEQARNEPVDDRTDLYSLGVVLYQMCAGRLPLVSDSITGQMIAIIAHRPPPLDTVHPDIPKPLSDLVAELLEKEPRDRPRSAGMLEQRVVEVTRLCREESHAALQIVTAEPAQSVAKAARNAKKRQPAEPPTDGKSTNKRRRSLWIASAVSGLLLLLLSAVYYATRPPIAAVVPAVSPDPPAPRESDRPRIRDDVLGVLELSSAQVVESQVPRGNAALFKLNLNNRALDERSDPRRVYRDAPVVARVVALIREEGGELRRAPMFPRELPPGQVPRSGKVGEIDMMLQTTSLIPGKFDVVFELRTPQDVTISSAATKLIVTEPPAGGN